MPGEGSLRDDFAMAALGGLLAQRNFQFPHREKEKECMAEADNVARMAYLIADAMEAESNRYQT